jgi:hypothetical protein
MIKKNISTVDPAPAVAYNSYCSVPKRSPVNLDESANTIKYYKMQPKTTKPWYIPSFGR